MNMYDRFWSSSPVVYTENATSKEKDASAAPTLHRRQCKAETILRDPRKLLLLLCCTNILVVYGLRGTAPQLRATAG